MFLQLSLTAKDILTRTIFFKGSQTSKGGIAIYYSLLIMNLNHNGDIYQAEMETRKE